MPTASAAAAWDREQRYLYNALHLLGRTSEARNVLQCGHQGIRYHCPYCDTNTDLPMSCRNRLCPRCAIARAAKFIGRHHTALSQMHSPRLLTLTFLSLPKLTPEALTKMSKDFSKLRRRKLWTDAIKGGIAGTEFTYGKHGWHPHYHALLDGGFIDIYELSDLWLEITGDSMVVYLQACTTTDGVYEVAKYVAKGSAFYHRKELVGEYLDVTKGRRFFTTFGSFYRAAEPEDKPKRTAWALARTLIKDPLGPGAPYIILCPKCQMPGLECYGHTTDGKIKAPPVQIPF